MSFFPIAVACRMASRIARFSYYILLHRARPGVIMKHLKPEGWKMASRKGTALLMVFVDIDTDQDADFNDWYNQEHVPDLLSLPGFLDGARYEAVKGGPRYLACYELETAEALKTPEYQEFRSSPSEWTNKVAPSKIGRNYVRNVYAQIYPQENDPAHMGRGMAPALQIGRMWVPEEIEAKYNEYYDTVRTPVIYRCLDALLFVVTMQWRENLST